MEAKPQMQSCTIHLEIYFVAATTIRKGSARKLLHSVINYLNNKNNGKEGTRGSSKHRKVKEKQYVEAKAKVKQLT